MATETQWFVSEQRSTQRWLGAASRIVLAEDSVQGQYHVLAEHSFYQFATGIYQTLNIYKKVGEDEAVRESIYVNNTTGISGTVIVEDLGIHGYNEQVTSSQFECGFYPSGGGSAWSNPSQATYTTPNVEYFISYDGNAPDADGSTPQTPKPINQSVNVAECGFERAGYHFVRWDTNSSGTGTSYNAGDPYTANASVTLYTIWERDHIAPSFTYMPTVIRVDDTPQHNPSDDGMNMGAYFFFTTDPDVSSVYVTVRTKESGTSAWTTVVDGVTALSSEGFFYAYTTSGEYALEKSYDVEIVIDDRTAVYPLGSNSTTYLTFLSDAKFLLDFFSNDRVAIGQPASDIMLPNLDGVLTLGHGWEMVMPLTSTRPADTDLKSALVGSQYAPALVDETLYMKKLLSLLVAGGGGGGGGITETSGGVTLDQCKTYPSTGWGWREIKYDDGRLEVWVWDWFSSTATTQYKDLTLPHNTGFVDYPNIILSGFNHKPAYNYNEAWMVSGIGMNAATYNESTTYTVGIRKTNGANRIIVNVKFEGHWK